MQVTANSAIGTLTVAVSELNADPLLQVVTKVASPLQLTVKTAKKATLSLELHSGLKLTQRNSIVRLTSLPQEWMAKADLTWGDLLRS